MRIVLITLFTLVFLSGCPGKKSTPESVTEAIEKKVANGGDCSLSRSPSLKEALNINSNLSGMVENADAACKSSVANLNSESAIRSINQMNSQSMRADDWAERLRDLDTEIAYLTTINVNNLYDQQIITLQERRTNASTQMRTSIVAVDNAQVAAKVERIEGLNNLVSGYQSVLENCQNADPRAIAAITNSALNVASSLGGLAGVSGLAASLMFQIVERIGDSLPNMNKEITSSLSQARLPSTLICSIEAVSKSFCEIEKQYSMIAIRKERDTFFSTCTVETGVQSFEQISEIIPHLEELYKPVDPRNPGNFPNDSRNMPKFTDNSGSPRPDLFQGEAPNSRSNDIEYQRRLNDLDDKMGQINAYTNSLTNYTELKDGDSDSVIGNKRGLKDTLTSLKTAIEKARAVIRKDDNATSLNEFFNDDDNNLQLLLEQASVHHEKILTAQLAQSSDSNSRSEDNVDYNFAVLANASARIAGTNTASSSISMTTDYANRAGDSEVSLSHATAVATNNMKNFSSFVTGNNVSIEQVIDQLLKDANGPSAARNTPETTANIIQQLCGASLTIYQTGIPQGLKERCKNFNKVPGRSFDDLANLAWADRVCIPIETGIIGE